MNHRQVIVRRGRRFGWWVEGRRATGQLFMKTWWPTEGLARSIASGFRARPDPGSGADVADGDAP